jgi:hypothetical protein
MNDIPLTPAFSRFDFAGAPLSAKGRRGKWNMDFFFPEDNLQRMTPEETRITSLTAEPYPDGYRLRVNIGITPFQKRPYLEVVLRDAEGEEVASSSIVEPLTWKLEFTMHIRGELKNPYTLEAKLFYPEGPTAGLQTFSFDVKPPPSTPGSESA